MNKMFYTFLVLTYVVSGVEIQDKTLYKNAWLCGDALPEVYEKIYAKYPDSMGQCIETNFSSFPKLKPKIRPKKLKNLWQDKESAGKIK